MKSSTDSRRVQQLVDNHRRFLQFVRPRVESDEVAEEILQQAIVRGLEREPDVRKDESVVAWFYRVLRNAIVDHYRHRGAGERAMAAEQRAQDASAAVELDLKDELCTCMNRVIDGLKPEYANILRAVDLSEQPLKDFAADMHISANNAGVRLHRARAALKRELERSCGTCATHGCLECSCRSRSGEDTAQV